MESQGSALSEGLKELEERAAAAQERLDSSKAAAKDLQAEVSSWGCIFRDLCSALFGPQNP